VTRSWNTGHWMLSTERRHGPDWHICKYCLLHPPHAGKVFSLSDMLPSSQNEAVTTYRVQSISINDRHHIITFPSHPLHLDLPTSDPGLKQFLSAKWSSRKFLSTSLGFLHSPRPSRVAPIGKLSNGPSTSLAHRPLISGLEFTTSLERRK
jgi:hypothetical protein